ncbi:MAG: DUF4147 domain-containing protein, partial [Pseudomonadota bacterium]
MFDAAVAAAHPADALPPHLPKLAEGEQLVVVGAGKAAAAMAAVTEAHYRAAGQADQISGEVVTRHGYSLADADATRTTVREAAHPTPDAASYEASAAALARVASAPGDATILVLLSGGASSLWTGHPPGIPREAYLELTKALHDSGATIGEFNTVRKHLSSISGGRLAVQAAPRRCLTLAISDVAGDDPSDIGSGPTVPDPTTLADAAAVLRKYDIAPAAPIAMALTQASNETPKPGDARFGAAEYTLVATPAMSLAAGAEIARAAGYAVEVLGDAVIGEAREVAAAHATRARELLHDGKKVALLSGGELTVDRAGAKTVGAAGGPNQEYALALAAALGDAAAGLPPAAAHKIFALAGDTDGADGGSGAADDPAG